MIKATMDLHSEHEEARRELYRLLDNGFPQSVIVWFWDTMDKLVDAADREIWAAKEGRELDG